MPGALPDRCDDPVKVMLTGTYSSHNKGDLTMQLVMAGQLQARGCDVASSVPFPDTDAKAYAAHGIPVVPSNRRKLVRATWQLARLMVWRLLNRVPRAEWVVPDADLELIRAADLVVDLSGDMLTDDYGPHVAYSHYLPLLVAHLCGTPYAIVAQSIGPFRYTGWLAKIVLRNAGLVTVRDELSIAHVAGLGLPEPTLTADLAFLLEGISVPGDTIGWPSGDVLGVSVSKLVESHYRRRNPHADAHSFSQVIAGDLDALAIRHSMAVVFFPQVTGPSREKDDRVAARRVAAMMKTPATVIDEDLDPAMLKGLIARCHVFVGARMHANIAALSSLVPAVPVAYSHKSRGIARELGVEHLVVDVSDLRPGAIERMVDTVLAEREALLANLENKLIDIRRRSRINTDLVMAQIDAIGEEHR